MNWEENRQAEIKELTGRGIIPVGMEDIENRPHLMGQVAAMVTVRTSLSFFRDVADKGYGRRSSPRRRLSRIW